MLSGWLKWRGFVPQWSDSGMAQTTAALASPLELIVGQMNLIELLDQATWKTRTKRLPLCTCRISPDLNIAKYGFVCSYLLDYPLS